MKFTREETEKWVRERLAQAYADPSIRKVSSVFSTCEIHPDDFAKIMEEARELRDKD